MDKPLPNWAIYLKMPKLTAHQAICLSFGLDPGKIHAYDSRGNAWGWVSRHSFNSVSGFNERKMLFTACHSQPISSRELSEWAQSMGWNIPIELAALAPVKIDAPQSLPIETVRNALEGVIFKGANVDELQDELIRLDVRFTLRDGVETVEIPDGTICGHREPLSNLYSALYYLKGETTTAFEMIAAPMNSGGGATGGYSVMRSGTIPTKTNVEAAPAFANELTPTEASTLPAKFEGERPTAPTTQIKLRRNSLDPAIGKAIEQAGNTKTADVYLKLKELALAEESPFTGICTEGLLSYTNDDDKPAVLSRDALRKRLEAHRKSLPTEDNGG